MAYSLDEVSRTSMLFTAKLYGWKISNISKKPIDGSFIFITIFKNKKTLAFWEEQKGLCAKGMVLRFFGTRRSIILLSIGRFWFFILWFLVALYMVVWEIGGSTSPPIGGSLSFFDSLVLARWLTVYKVYNKYTHTHTIFVQTLNM